MKTKQWCCKNGHVLGLVQWNGAGVPQLMVYRHAIDAEAEMPEAVDVVMGPLMGQMAVRCDAPGCEDVQVWKVSVETMLYLVEMMPTAMLFDFWKRLLERAKVQNKIMRDEG